MKIKDDTMDHQSARKEQPKEVKPLQKGHGHPSQATGRD